MALVFLLTRRSFLDIHCTDAVPQGAFNVRSSLALCRCFAGVAVLLFSPPVDGTYRFSISCGGCERTLRTEKRQFAAGTRASLRVTSQPSGAVSGAVLEHQPEAQLEDLDGQPIRIKSTVVANIIPIDLNGKGGSKRALFIATLEQRFPLTKIAACIPCFCTKRK